MKKIVIFVAAALMLASCGNRNTENVEIGFSADSTTVEASPVVDTVDVDTLSTLDTLDTLDTLVAE